VTEEILINITPRETRVAVVENGMLQEVHVERALRRGYVGNIYKGKVSRITFWGLDDGMSWLNDWPIRGRTNYPLLFDRNYQPKKAYFTVIATKQQP